MIPPSQLQVHMYQNVSDKIQACSQTIGMVIHTHEHCIFIVASGSAIPVADIRGVDSMNYGKGEKILRCKLASCYRLVDLYGWSNGINNHITVSRNVAVLMESGSVCSMNNFFLLVKRHRQS